LEEIHRTPLQSAARAIRTFWQADYWDRFIRNDAHFESAIGYIDNNPVKAGLARTPADWTWGSARFMR
jgi:putative transposase